MAISTGYLRFGWCALVLLLTMPGAADAQQEGTVDRIDRLIRPYADTRNFSGTVLASRGDSVVYERSFGMANYELRMPVTSMTRFNIASLTKTFTAAAILRLQDQGLLNVDDSVSRFLPDYPRGGDITIEHLLTHHSGLPRIVFLPDYRELSTRRYTTGEVVELFIDLPLVAEPGQRYAYSNANYVLLARIIEVLSGLTYGQFLEEEFFDRLGLVHTADVSDPRPLMPNRASGYDPVEMRDLENSRYFDFSIAVGAGSLFSTASDLTRWIRALAAGRILTPESTRLMFDEPNYGLIVDERFGRKLVTMSGWSDVGFTASMTFSPDDDLVVVVLNNIDISSVAGEIGDGVAGVLLGEDASGLSLFDRPVEPELALAATGLYRFGADFFVPNSSMTVVEKGGQLYVREPAENRDVGLLRVGELVFIHRSSWGRVEFRREADGRISGMQFYGRFEVKKDSSLRTAH